MLNGAIAQLGERLHGMQEVASSNLVGSIVAREVPLIRSLAGVGRSVFVLQ